MSKLTDLFPGFDAKHFPTRAGNIFARIGGDGPPLLLLHGYPQSGAMWHLVAPELSKKFRIVIADLPGYGGSDAPESGEGHAPYDKRSIAAAMVEVMQQLGFREFSLMGHDRGGRVSYRMALDHPDRVKKLCTLDIVPTYEMWASIDMKRAMKVFHWTFLAQPVPLPEMLIGKAPLEYMDWKLAAWNGKNTTSVFDPRALEHYHENFRHAARIHASCEDYRAGQTTDYEHDAADLKSGKKIICPMLALWGSSGIPSQGPSPIETWKKWANNVTGGPVESGHFLPEENPKDTLAAVIPFLTKS
jgi:haloacetate dehalogenase